MRRPAVLLLLLLSVGSIAPFARAAFDNATCCCPDGSASCPVHESGCSWKSGCGSEHDATLVPLAVFSLPPETHGLTLAPGKEFESELLVSTVSRAVPVPDPPPRA